MALSLRGQDAGKPSDRYLIWTIIKDLWDAQQNPDGYLSLGVAENTLMHDKFIQHARANFHITTRALTYGDGMAGTNRLREAMGEFLSERLDAFEPITAGHITVTNGCSTAIEHLSWCLSNPGDGILLGQPFFRGFIPSIGLRTDVKVVPVSFTDLDPYDIDGVRAYENAINQSSQRGQKISALMLCNPHNPTGRCYTREAIVGLMRLCEKYKIHFISDELYALSTWENVEDGNSGAPPFISCLSIDTTGLIDPSRLHVIWGISKDLGANGLRIGAIISQHNPTLQAALVPLALYSSCSSVADHITASMLMDTPWINGFLDENRRLLSESYSFAVQWAQRNNIVHAPGASAAFFLWVDLGQAYCDRHPEVEKNAAEEIVDRLFLKHKVFVAAGSQFGAEKSGWFRVTFACSKQWLEEGFRRILLALCDN